MRDQIKYLIAILFVAILLRLWGIDFGLPYLYHPDEPNKIEMAQKMFVTGDLNPRWFHKPSVLIYLNAIPYVPYYAIGKLAGFFNQPADIQPPLMLTMGVGKTSFPITVLMGRSLTALAGVLAVFLVYKVGKRYVSENVGLWAALMMAISPTNVTNSRYITENSMLAAAILFVALFSYWIYVKGDLRDYVLAGLATGIAISIKYPGVIAGIFIIFAHFMRTGWRGVKDYQIYIAFTCIPLAFLIGTPYALLDFQTFSKQVFSQYHHYSQGHTGMEGNALGWYLQYAWLSEGLVNIFALAGILWGIYRRNWSLIVLSGFTIIYFIFISSFEVRNDRTFLPLTPFLFIYAADSWILFKQSLSKRIPKFGPLIGYLLMATSLCFLAYNTVTSSIKLTTPNSRETAAFWIQENLPEGVKIAIEPYAPFVEPTQFEVAGMGPLIDHEPEWYVENGFDYLVFGSGMYGRFYREPEKYREQITLYNQLFDQFPLVKVFNDGGYEVKIYQVTK